MVKNLTNDQKIETNCFVLDRKVKQVGQMIHIRWYYENRCEKLSTTEYLEHMPVVQDMRKLLEQEIVLEQHTLNVPK